MDSNFTLKDLQDDFCIQEVLMDIDKLFVELDGYYELANLGRDKPLSREEFVKFWDLS